MIILENLTDYFDPPMFFPTVEGNGALHRTFVFQQRVSLLLGCCPTHLRPMHYDAVRYDEVHRHRLFYFETHLSVPYFNRLRCQDEQNQNYE